MGCCGVRMENRFEVEVKTSMRGCARGCFLGSLFLVQVNDQERS